MEEYLSVVLAVVACCILVFFSCINLNYYSEADILDFLTDVKYASISNVNFTRIYYFPFKVSIVNGSIIVSKPIVQVYFAEVDNIIKAPVIVSRNITLTGLVKLRVISYDNSLVYIEVVDKKIVT